MLRQLCGNLLCEFMAKSATLVDASKLLKLCIWLPE